MTTNEMLEKLKNVDGHEKSVLLSTIMKGHADNLKKMAEDTEQLLHLLDEMEERQRGQK